MLATDSLSPFDLKLNQQRELEDKERRRQDAERAELLAHESQFITVAEIARAVVESGREGYTVNLWQAIHATLTSDTETVIFCHWEGGERWTPLPSPDICPAVVGTGNTVEPAAKWDREPMKGPIGYYIGDGFVCTGDNAAFAVRRELAARLFGLEEPRPRSAPKPIEPGAEPASAPAMAVPEPVTPPAEAVPDAGTVRHKLKSTRRNPLDAVYARAKREATDPTCPHSVWAALVAMATGSNPPRELGEYRRTTGMIKATGARGGWLKKSAVMDKWRNDAKRVKPS